MTLLRTIAAAILASATAAAAQNVEVWTFDRLDRLGGHPVTVLGSPRVIDTELGKAVLFDGVDDALMVDVHPLQGAETFTWEAIFRPDGGEPAQRWFHLQETGSDDRMLFEIRVVVSKWYFDSYLHSGSEEKALIDRDKLHPLGRWYHVAAVYDGAEFSNYVDGVRQVCDQVVALCAAGALAAGIPVDSMRNSRQRRSFIQ